MITAQWRDRARRLGRVEAWRARVYARRWRWRGTQVCTRREYRAAGNCLRRPAGARGTGRLAFTARQVRTCDGYIVKLAARTGGQEGTSCPHVIRVGSDGDRRVGSGAQRPVGTVRADKALDSCWGPIRSRNDRLAPSVPLLQRCGPGAEESPFALGPCPTSKPVPVFGTAGHAPPTGVPGRRARARHPTRRQPAASPLAVNVQTTRAAATRHERSQAKKLRTSKRCPKF